MSYTLTVWWPRKEGQWEMHGHFIARAEEIAARVTRDNWKKCSEHAVYMTAFGKEYPTATSGRGTLQYKASAGSSYIIPFDEHALSH